MKKQSDSLIRNTVADAAKGGVGGALAGGVMGAGIGAATGGAAIHGLNKIHGRVGSGKLLSDAGQLMGKGLMRHPKLRMVGGLMAGLGAAGATAGASLGILGGGIHGAVKSNPTAPAPAPMPKQADALEGASTGGQVGALIGAGMGGFSTLTDANATDVGKLLGADADRFGKASTKGGRISRMFNKGLGGLHRVASRNPRAAVMLGAGLGIGTLGAGAGALIGAGHAAAKPQAAAQSQKIAGITEHIPLIGGSIKAMSEDPMRGYSRKETKNIVGNASFNGGVAGGVGGGILGAGAALGLRALTKGRVKLKGGALMAGAGAVAGSSAGTAAGYRNARYDNEKNMAGWGDGMAKKSMDVKALRLLRGHPKLSPKQYNQLKNSWMDRTSARRYSPVPRPPQRTNQINKVASALIKQYTDRK